MNTVISSARAAFLVEGRSISEPEVSVKVFDHYKCTSLTLLKVDVNEETERELLSIRRHEIFTQISIAAAFAYI